MRKFAVILLCAAISACTVGPNYTRPDVPLPQRFAEGGDAQGAGAATPLWSAFDDATLQALIARANAANTTVAQAIARLDEQRALRGLSTFSWFPTVTAGADGERSKPSGRDPFVPSDQGTTTTYKAGFDASWEIDLFGSLRRQNQAIRRDVEAEEAALADVRRAIVAETAQAYFALRGTQAQLALQQRNLKNLQENVDLLQAQLDAGRGTELDLARARALGLGVAAQIPGIEADVSRQEQRLAVLTAQTIDTLREQLGPPAPMPALPALQALGTPEEWLARRPDVRAAERRAAAASARVGVQIAEYFPKLNLLGGFGYTAQTFGDLGGGDTERWRWGPSLSWSFLDFGRVRQRAKAAQARSDGAIAAYQETVLRALEETENALAAYRASNRTAAALDEAVRESARSAELARLRFDAGASDYLAVLDAERSLIDFENRLAQARTQQATSLAALYKALAGDFAERAPEADASASNEATSG